MQLPKYGFDEETGKAWYELYDGNMTFRGEASCHPDDMDMISQLTGLAIAEARAAIAYETHIRDNILKPQLASVKQLYYAMNRSKNFNPKSYENKMLYRHIRNLENDLTIIKESIATIKLELRQYLANKEVFYQKIRKQRALGQEPSKNNSEKSE